EGQHVVLAKRVQLDVPYEDDFAVVLLKHRGTEDGVGIQTVAVRQVLVRFGYPLGSLYKSLSVGVLSKRNQHFADVAGQRGGCFRVERILTQIMDGRPGLDVGCAVLDVLLLSALHVIQIHPISLNAFYSPRYSATLCSVSRRRIEWRRAPPSSAGSSSFQKATTRFSVEGMIPWRKSTSRFKLA